ncbi:MAG: hypothetical protein ISS25_02045 [Nanoarchaeota archaeon]|nr:hypothetical protein [DPANN group archaeon]MBL7116587.1 hypothetical protein [Nanoarchaeota archaeon]
MIDELFFKQGLARRKLNFIFFGFIVTIVGFLTSLILFNADSLATLLVITMLLMPVLMRLFRKEEVIVREKRLKKIFENHKFVFETYFFLFLGIFFAFLILQLTTIYNQDFFATAFEFQSSWVVKNQESLGVIDDSISGVIVSSLINDLLIMVVSFLLSFFYGSGGIFLIIAAASILSTTLIYLLRFFESFFGFTLFLLATLIIYVLPLIFVFIITSTAGGILSKAVISEKIFGKHFQNVLRDAVRLFIYAIVLLVVINALKLLLALLFL